MAFGFWICFAVYYCTPYLDLGPAVLTLFPMHKQTCTDYGFDWSEDQHIIFELYDRKRPEEPFELLPTKESFDQSTYNASVWTQIIFHDFMQSSDNVRIAALAKAYLRYTNNNVIVVDCWRLFAGPWYTTAVANVDFVAQRSYELIRYIQQYRTTDQGLNVVGLGIGAHCAGMAMKRIKNCTNCQVNGLDPARFMFAHNDTTRRLTANDAPYVGVIHTDAGFLGQSSSSGMVDFWPHYGYCQPGCEYTGLVQLIERAQNTSLIDALFGLYFCNHWRAIEYFTESVENSFTKFEAEQCVRNDITGKMTNCGRDRSKTRNMGGLFIRDLKIFNGDYYLEVNRDPPYSKT